MVDRFDWAKAGMFKIDEGAWVSHSDYATLEAENARLREINANLMGDDEDAPRYTTKRLKQEIAKAAGRTEASAAVKVLPEIIEEQAWNCDEWPKWLHKVVEQTNEIADKLDMSSEQAHAYAALLALSPAPQEAEAVACRYRWPKSNGAMDRWTYAEDISKAESLLGDDGQIELLYTHQHAQEVKP